MKGRGRQCGRAPAARGVRRNRRRGVCQLEAPPKLGVERRTPVVLNRADVRHMRGEREAALADCESAKALDGKNPVTYLLAAQIYEEMGNAEQALAHYKELHRLAPRAFRKIPEEYLQEISEKDYKELQKEKEEAKKAREEKEKEG